MTERRLELCAVGSLLAHLALLGGMQRLPARAPAHSPTLIAMRIVEAPRPTRLPDPERSDPPPNSPPPHEPKRRLAARPPTQATPEPQRIASERRSPNPDANATPQFGITMESTSQASAGPSMPVGNTLRATGATHEVVQALPEGVTPASEVTKMPLPLGRCTGEYTEAARAAAIEGVVVLDLTVDARGRARDIRVVEGLSHGLTQAALDALAECRFTPGERAGHPVPVRVSGFKIRFVMPDAP